MRRRTILNIHRVRHSRTNRSCQTLNMLLNASKQSARLHRSPSTHQRVTIIHSSSHEPRQKLLFDLVSKEGEIQTPLRNLNLNAQRLTSYNKPSHVRSEHALELFVESLNRNKFNDHLVYLNLWAHFPLEDPVKHIRA